MATDHASASSGAEPSTDPFCPECGYDLRAIASDRCPECGLAIDRESLAISRLPWAHRAKIGRFRAYWRTNLLAIFRSKRLAQEMSRPVSFGDAQRFRHITVLLAWLPIAAWLVYGMISALDDPFKRIHQGDPLGWIFEGAAAVACFFAAWLFLLMISGVASYFFHPRRLPIVQQNRAIALSYYAAAPLAWLWVPAALYAVLYAITAQPWGQQGFGDRLGVALAIGAFVVLIAILLVWWIRTIGLMRRTTHGGSARAVMLAVVLLLAWPLAFAIAAAIPAIVLYVGLVVLSFR